MNNGEYLIGLLANVVAGKPLPEPDDNIDLLKVYEIAENTVCRQQLIMVLRSCNARFLLRF